MQMGSTAELVTVKESDYLDQDPPLRGQNFVCVSFLPNGDVIRNKDVFMFNKFISSFANDLDEFFTNTSERFKDDVAMVDMLRSLKDRYDYIFNAASLEHEYDHFKKVNNDDLEKEYFEKNSFQTSMSGLKVRGTYDTFREAQHRAEQIQKFDKLFHVFVGQVGCWLPWSPYPEDVQDQEYSETQLNTLMKKYKEGQELKRELYELRKNDLISKVQMHNEKIKEENQPTPDTADVTTKEAPSVDTASLEADDTWVQKVKDIKPEEV